ncbi:MAG: metalloregulator ArsR/SmtB family transcription factor [Acidimicrobiia bacterium]|jgi:DNA-binding transcriptional ArsR family regulator
MDDVFKALGDPSRRRLLDRLNARNGQNLSELCAGMDMTRQSVTKHLEILEAADLVVIVRRGRERLHYLNAAPIHDIADRWIGQYHRERVRALADLKNALESTPMETQSFVYATYIKTTPEQLWQGLTNPEFTKRYWDMEFVTDWTAGARMTWHQRGVTIDDPAQVVLEADPYRRLSYTWHTFTPELAREFDIADDVIAKLATERRSKVTFEIEDLGAMVKLTVVHDDFDADSIAVTMVSQGWPRVLSDLKTLLETGETLPT